jgi:hypothetical protein
MSEIITDKLTGKTSAGDVTITSEGGSATMQLQQGVAKVVFSFDGSDTTPSYKHSVNTSSLTDNGTGDYTVVFANNMGDKEYTFAGSFTHNSSSSGLFAFMIKDDANWDGTNKNTSQVRLESAFANSSSDKTNFDYRHQNGTVHGDLA